MTVEEEEHFLGFLKLRRVIKLLKVYKVRINERTVETDNFLVYW